MTSMIENNAMFLQIILGKLNNYICINLNMVFEKIKLILPQACERLEHYNYNATEEEIQEGIKLAEQRYKQQLKDSIGE